MNNPNQEISTLLSEMQIKVADIKAEIASVKSDVIKWVFDISFA